MIKKKQNEINYHPRTISVNKFFTVFFLLRIYLISSSILQSARYDSPETILLSRN